MRIERIEIDGFGRFHDSSWTFAEGLTVLHGANEAGKTTLLNALRALLFGFEATRDGRTWYPALAGGRRGGRLVLATATGERWTVERHGERGGSGALAVRAPNGNQGGQETLDRLLHGADRDLFNNIFAFGLGELQTFASLSADGVRGRIYGAGAGLGGTSAVDLERRLRQQLDATYLPRGRERPLNRLLARIEELRAEIAELSRQPEEHAAAHRERAELRERSATLRAAVRLERERASRVAHVLEALPVAAEMAIVADELAAGDATLDDLPEDAVSLLDLRLERLGEAEAALAHLDDEIAGRRADRERLEPDERALAKADAIVALRDEAVAEAGRADRRRELELAATRHQAAFDEQLARAGGLDARALLALDDSIVGVERTRELEARLVEARSVASDAERRRAAAVEELDARLREAAPGEDADGMDDRLAALDALDEIRIRRAVADARRSRGGRLAPGVGLVTGIGAGLAVLLAGLAVGQPAVGLLAGIGLAAAVVLLTRGTAEDDPGQLEAERRELLVRAGLDPDASDAAVRSAATELAERRARIGLARDHREGLEARRAELGRRERDAAAAAEVLAEARSAWGAWLAERGLPADLSPDGARQVLSAAGAARRAAAERDHQQTIIASLVAESDVFAARVDALALALGSSAVADGAARSGLVNSLVERLEQARDSARRAGELEAALQRLGERRRALAETVAERAVALRDHLESLNCQDADALRARQQRAAERRALVAKARELEARLAGAAGGPDAVRALVAEARSADSAALEASLADARAQVERLEEEEREVLNRIGALDARIRQLEGAEELGARRQELASIEGQAAAMAREWAVGALALRLLEETRGRYERERQPDVVRAATGHFERVTGGRYARIVAPPGDHAVLVESEGGEQLGTDELSRGTAEQLYLALRFGLIEEFARHAEPLPVVMDDILVNFDPERAARAAVAIRELATRHQVLYFTCHRSTAELLDPDVERTVALA